VVAIAASLLAGCSTLESLNPFGGERYEMRVLPDESAESIYDQGLVRLQRKDFEGAARKFAELEKQFPFSQWSRKGLLMVTYSNFEGQKYDEAVLAGNRYVSLYPSTPETPYALYLIGMSMYNQIPDISRDQDRADQAVKVFNDLIQLISQHLVAGSAKFSTNQGFTYQSRYSVNDFGVFTQNWFQELQDCQRLLAFRDDRKNVNHESILSGMLS
jgi:outer membrane protein assembly factor BamD